MKIIETLLRKKLMIEIIFIFPLISSVGIAICLKNFVDMNYRLPYISHIRHLFTIIVLFLFINLIANFIGLTLYFCLFNRMKNFLNKYKK